MRKYDYEKAKKLIAENANNLKNASLGMHEDWFWTAQTVWEDGKYEKELNDETNIGGINGSYWATPTLQLCFNDGSDKMIECSTGEKSEKKVPELLLGVLSAPVQESITPLSE